MQVSVPRECFKYGSGQEQIQNEGGKPYEVIGISTNETIQLYIKDSQATWAVFVDGDILSKTNSIKSLFIENIRLFVRKQFILGTLYTFLKTRELEKLLTSFNKQAFRTASIGGQPYFLKEKHLTSCSRELQFAIFTFLVELGISEETSDKFSEIFVHMLEYDNAYRFRFMDIMGSTSKEELKSHHKAIRSLIERIRQRDWKGVAEKYVRIVKLVGLALIIPKIRKAFDKTIDAIELTNLQPQEADLYWMCSPNSYKFMGKTDEERAEIAKEKGWKYPDGMI